MIDGANTSLVHTTGVDIGFQKERVLIRDLNLDVREGDMFVLSGPNGSGKTTLLRTIMGQIPPVKGKIALGVSRQDVGFLPQLQNMTFALPATLMDVLRCPAPRSCGPDCIMKWGLIEKRQLSLAWNTSSGGERRRVLLTRVLVQNPTLLVLDEPLTHLDPESLEKVLKALKMFLSESDRRGILMVAHELPSEFTEIFSPKEIRLGD